MKEPKDTFEELEQELLKVFRRGVGQSLAPEAFNRLALRVFRYQCRANRPFGAFIAHRGVDPDGLEGWEKIPHLPTRAFKTAELVADEGSAPEAVFRTSGTTGGGETRGRHLIRSLGLYRASLLPTFQAFLLPEGSGLPMLALLPSPTEAPDSSLSFMVGEVKEKLCQGIGGFFADSSGGVQVPVLLQALREAEALGDPVLLIGTAFAFVHWLEEAEKEGWRVRLPDGSRLMETGGFKGRTKVLSKDALYSRLEASYGIPTTRMVNEYGMTELLSQFYEPILDTTDDPPPGLGGRHHVGPPWVQTRVLDPMTLEAVPNGEVGILAHFDLANLGSVSGILTEDLGRAVPGGFVLQGRHPGAEPRGCSLTMEAFLEGQRGDHDAF